MGSFWQYTKLPAFYLLRAFLLICTMGCPSEKNKVVLWGLPNILKSLIALTSNFSGLFLSWHQRQALPRRKRFARLIQVVVKQPFFGRVTFQRYYRWAKGLHPLLCNLIFRVVVVEVQKGLSDEASVPEIKPRAKRDRCYEMLAESEQAEEEVPQEPQEGTAEAGAGTNIGLTSRSRLIRTGLHPGRTFLTSRSRFAYSASVHC